MWKWTDNIISCRNEYYSHYITEAVFNHLPAPGMADAIGTYLVVTLAMNLSNYKHDFRPL